VGGKVAVAALFSSPFTVDEPGLRLRALSLPTTVGGTWASGMERGSATMRFGVIIIWSSVSLSDDDDDDDDDDSDSSDSFFSSPSPGDSGF